MIHIAIDKAVKDILLQEKKYLILQYKSKIKKQDIRQIYYIDVLNHKLNFHTEMGVYSVPGSIRDVKEKISGHPFVLCNNGIMVNLQYVTDVQKNVVTVAGQELLISRSKKKAFIQALIDYVEGKFRIN